MLYEGKLTKLVYKGSFVPYRLKADFKYQVGSIYWISQRQDYCIIYKKQDYNKCVLIWSDGSMTEEYLQLNYKTDYVLMSYLYINPNRRIQKFELDGLIISFGELKALYCNNLISLSTNIDRTKRFSKLDAEEDDFSLYRLEIDNNGMINNLTEVFD